MSKLEQIPIEIRKRVLEWLEGPIDAKSKAEILDLIEWDQRTLLNAFSSDLAFGTSGLRELMGVGPNRVNLYTVGKATQGFANSLREEKKSGPILIAYDNRKDSYLFASRAAQILAANGIRVYILKEIRPSPFLSYLVLNKKYDGGIMITASHNPKEYNGYEIYGVDGGENSLYQEEKIQNEIKKITSFDQVIIAPFDDPLIVWIDPEVWDEEYLQAISDLQSFKEEAREFGASLQIVYSSLHGTGITLIPKALKSWGFTNLSFVEEQITPDSEFPTLHAPNPGEAGSLTLGVKKLEESHGDLFIANDCDADRIGIAVMHQGQARIFNGNEFATLCAYHLCTAGHPRWHAKKGAFIISFVTTELVKVIATSFGIACFEVPTGFKYIAEKINEWDKSKSDYKFIFGAEESYGCLLGTYARTKDGVAAACFISEVALHAKRKGKTLVDLLHEIYCKYGIFREKLYSMEFAEDNESLQKRINIMEEFRKNPLRQIGENQVVFVEDYLQANFYHTDMLLFRLDDETKVILRPSGTEASLRIHIACRVKEFSTIEEGIAKGDHHIENILQLLLSVIKCLN